MEETGKQVNGAGGSSIRIAILEKQVASLNSNFDKLESKIESNYVTLHKRISELRDDLHNSIEKKHDKLIEKIDDQINKDTEQHKALADKVQQIEKWRWMIMGAAVVVGFLIGKINVGGLFG